MILSWSKIEVFNQCKRKFWLLHGSKEVLGQAIIPFSTNKYTERGRIIHNLMTAALQGGELSSEDRQLFWNPVWDGWVAKLKGANIQLNLRIGIDRDLKAYELDKWYKVAAGKDGPVGGVLLHGELDAVVHKNQQEAIIFDWKTGRVRYPEKFSQLSIYTLLLKCSYPTLKTIFGYNVFLDYNKLIPARRTSIPEITQQLLLIDSHVKKYFKDNVRDNECNPPEPCGLCPANQQQCVYSYKKG